MISETKIDDSIPLGNFLIDGFSKPYRLDCHSLGWDILLYVREDIPSNVLEVETKPIATFYGKINWRNDKSLINFSCNPHKSMIRNHISALSEIFNIEMEEQQIKTFCDNYDSESLLRHSICCKNPSNSTYIDLILTNAPQKIQST